MAGAATRAAAVVRAGEGLTTNAWRTTPWGRGEGLRQALWSGPPCPPARTGTSTTSRAGSTGLAGADAARAPAHGVRVACCLLDPNVVVEVLSKNMEAHDRGAKAAHDRRQPSVASAAWKCRRATRMGRGPFPRPARREARALRRCAWNRGRRVLRRVNVHSGNAAWAAAWRSQLMGLATLSRTCRTLCSSWSSENGFGKKALSAGNPRLARNSPV